MDNFLADFKGVWNIAAKADTHDCSFLITDTEIKDEGFLEGVNSFLNTGEVANMLDKADKETAISEMDRVYGKIVAEAKPEEKWKLAINKVRDDFHIVLAFSPVGDKFRDRFVKFPSLFTTCNIDW